MHDARDKQGQKLKHPRQGNLDRCLHFGEPVSAWPAAVYVTGWVNTAASERHLVLQTAAEVPCSISSQDSTDFGLRTQFTAVRGLVTLDPARLLLTNHTEGSEAPGCIPQGTRFLPCHSDPCESRTSVNPAIRVLLRRTLGYFCFQVTDFRGLNKIVIDDFQSSNYCSCSWVLFRSVGCGGRQHRNSGW